MPAATRSEQSGSTAISQTIKAKSSYKEHKTCDALTSAEASSNKGPASIGAPMPEAYDKHRQRDHFANNNTKARYRRPSRRRRRSWIYTALLPFSYTAIILLHIVFALASKLAQLASILRRKNYQEHDVLYALSQLGLKEGKSDAVASPELRIPKHLALVIPISPPSTSRLLWHLFSRANKRLSLRAWSFLTSAPVPARKHSSCDSLSKHDANPWQEHEASDTEYRFDCLKRVLTYAALAGVQSVSVWDQDCVRSEESLEALIGKDRSYDEDAQTWTITASVPRTHAAGSRVLDVATLRVEIWDAQRRRGERAAACAGEDSQASSLQHISSSSSSSTELTIRLNLLTPRNDGRESFATISRTIAQDFLQQATHSASLSSASFPLSPRRQDWLKQRVDKLTLSDVNAALKTSGHLDSEPELLLVLCSNNDGGRGANRTRTIGDFPRWHLRITEMCHSPSGAREFNAQRFWDALQQFTKAEQRYGR